MDTSPKGSAGTTTDDPNSSVLPSWLTSHLEQDPAPLLNLSKEQRALHPVQFEMVFQRVLDLISSGSTLTSALRDLPMELDSGAFIRWIKKDHVRAEAYKDAKETRTEAWAGKLVEYAEAKDAAEDVQRSKLKVDTLKWLMGADNRKAYGDVKQIDVGGSISITGALAAANQRAQQVIEAEVTEVIETIENHVQPIEQDDDD